MIISLGNLSLKDSISFNTKFQSSLPFPAPIGGIAIDFIFSSFIKSSNCFNPVIIYSILEFSLQVLLVGKFIIILFFSFVQTKGAPISKSFLSHLIYLNSYLNYLDIIF